MPTVQAQPLRCAVSRVLMMAGVPEPEAALVADHLVEADLAGVTSHGIIRLPQYLQAIHDGKVTVDANLRVVKQHQGTAVLEGGGGFGQVMARKAMDLAVEL